jgi:HD superfamily phosphohydrolase
MTKEGREKALQGVMPRLVGQASQKLLEPYKTFRVAVSGDVTLTKLETEILDTRDFQRLRYIKQLGSAYLVYPTALHTRFDHSLGTLNEATRFVRNIRENPQSSSSQKGVPDEDELLIRLAALLHDVTHVPFGHTLEDETRVLAMTHAEDKSRRESFLGRGSDIGKKLLAEIGEENYSKLMGILSTEHLQVPNLGKIAYIADIVNNTLCADLIDYLKRDLYFCYLTESFGERFLRYLFLEDVKTGANEAKRLVVRLWKQKGAEYYPRRDVLSELLNLLRVRYTLAERVYFHNTKLASGAMIARAIWSARKRLGGQKLEDRDLFSCGDEVILSLVEKFNPVSKRLVDAVRERAIHKLVYSFPRGEADTKRLVPTLESGFRNDFENRAHMEDNLARLVGSDPGDVLICCPSAEMNKKHASMLVTWGTGAGDIKELKDIREEEDLATYRLMDSILKLHDALWNFKVFASPKIRGEERLKEHLASMCTAFTAPAEKDKKIKEATHKRVLDIAREMAPVIGTIDVRLVDTIVEEAISVRRGPSDQISDAWIKERIRKSGSSSLQNEPAREQ